MVNTELLQPLSQAPTDGTPFLFVYGDFSGAFIAVYGDFENGYSAVEECSGAFYRLGEMTDYVSTSTSGDFYVPLPQNMIDLLESLELE